MVAGSFPEITSSDIERLQRFAVLMTGNPSDAADLVQASLEKYLDQVARGLVASHPMAYVKSTIATTYINEARRAARWRELVARFDRPHFDGHSDDIGLRDVLASGLNRLPPHQRTAIVLRYYEDRTFAQIAHDMNCAEATARSLVHRGLKSLRIFVKDDLDD